MEMSNKKPLISVLMGIYNCADTLQKAVACIQNQTYENWELIMCDDCSADNTYAVACELAQQDERIRVLKNERNLTLAPTLNKCLKEAKGKYIARMDGDDTCSPERFEKELAFLESHSEFAMVSCNMALVGQYGVFRVIEYKPEPELKDFLSTNQHCHAACMARTRVIKAIGGYSEAKSRRRVEDYDLWVRMYLAGFRGYNLQEVLYDMFDAEAALKRRKFSNRLNESRVILTVCKNTSGFHYHQALMPLIKWLIPTSLYKHFHKNKGE